MVVNSETQYSIYKINFEAVENIFSNVSHGSNNTEYAENIIDILINSTTKIIKDKQKSTVANETTVAIFSFLLLFNDIFYRAV